MTKVFNRTVLGLCDAYDYLVGMISELNRFGGETGELYDLRDRILDHLADVSKLPRDTPVLCVGVRLLFMDCPEQALSPAGIRLLNECCGTAN